MSTPHQAHNIPWSLLTSHLALVRPSPQQPHLSAPAFCPTNTSNETADIAHFARKVAWTISDFATTERAKYPAKIGLDKQLGGKVIPDSFLGARFRHGCTIKSHHQTVDYWQNSPAPVYTLDEGGLADLVKRLYLPSEPHVPNLLFLAQLPGSCLGSLRHVTYSNFFHYGTDRVYQDALTAYILVNVYVSFGLYGEAFVETSNYSQVVGAITGGQDYDSQMELHRAFFGKGNEQLQDLTRFKQYLKDCFWQLYVSEMVVREINAAKGEDGADEKQGIEWESEVRWCLAGMFPGFPSPEPCD